MLPRVRADWKGHQRSVMLPIQLLMSNTCSRRIFPSFPGFCNPLSRWYTRVPSGNHGHWIFNHSQIARMRLERHRCEPTEKWYSNSAQKIWYQLYLAKRTLSFWILTRLTFLLEG